MVYWNLMLQVGNSRSPDKTRQIGNAEYLVTFYKVDANRELYLVGSAGVEAGDAEQARDAVRYILEKEFPE